MRLFDIFRERKKSKDVSAKAVSIDESVFTIEDDILIKYTPKERTFQYEVFVPDTVRCIAKGDFELSTNVLKVHIPTTISYIDDDAFKHVKYVKIIGKEGSYAEKYAGAQKGSLPSFEFISDYFEDKATLERDLEKANATTYDDAIKPFMRFEKRIALPIKLPPFPQELFYASSKSELGEKDLFQDTCIIIKMESKGCLVAETRNNISAPHSGKILSSFSTTRSVDFSELPSLIKHSKDGRANQYAKMTEENWRDYLAIPQKKASSLPIVQFGQYRKYFSNPEPFPIDWFVLAEKEGKVLLLAREGLDLCQYDDRHLLREYTPNWQTSNLYNWLNCVFYSKAFNDNEKKHIAKASKTTPNVFCLSKEEFKLYLSEDPAAQVMPTDYSQKKGAFVCTISYGLDNYYHQFEGNGSWWLRDEIGEGRLLEGNACVASVTDRGTVGWSLSDSPKICARPAIWVSTDYWIKQHRMHNC